jgi:predicted AAA+ superfamily ATPase
MTETENNIPDYPRGITFEQVWAAMMEDRKKQDELGKYIEETSRMVKDLSVQMGGLHRSFGELAEHLVAPGIVRRFNEIGYHFDSIAPQGIRIYDESRKKILTEIDLLLENGECLIAVEVKSKPTEKDIAHHTGRLEILRDWRNKRQEKPKRILGAIAGAVFSENLKAAVAEAGLYVIEQTGDTMQINVPEGFRPREW